MAHNLLGVQIEIGLFEILPRFKVKYSGYVFKNEQDVEGPNFFYLHV